MFLESLLMLIFAKLVLYKKTIKIVFCIVMAITAIIAYCKSLASRKYYRCPKCGESFRTEQMTAECCKVCGSKLEEINDKNVNDKAI